MVLYLFRELRLTACGEPLKKTTLVRPVRFKVKSVSGQRENSLVPVEATLPRDRTRAAQKLLATGKQGDNRVDYFTEGG